MEKKRKTIIREENELEKQNRASKDRQINREGKRLIEVLEKSK